MCYSLAYLSFLIVGFPFGCRYEQAEFIEREMEQMTEQIKSIIQTLNASQVMLFSQKIFIFR